MTKQTKKDKTMTAMMNLNHVEALIANYDNPNADLFELSRKLEELANAADNKVSLVKKM